LKFNRGDNSDSKETNDIDQVDEFILARETIIVVLILEARKVSF